MIWLVWWLVNDRVQSGRCLTLGDTDEQKPPRVDELVWLLVVSNLEPGVPGASLLKGLERGAIRSYQEGDLG